jgi:predicted nuclease of predicted toxin-antitoxin system
VELRCLTDLVKLLFDHNLPHRLPAVLEDLFPSSAHVRALGLERSDDQTIWERAAAHGFAIVTKDDDFRQRSFVFGGPPKVIWLRIGNCAAAEVEQLLRARWERVRSFGSDPVAALLVLDGPT